MPTGYSRSPRLLKGALVKLSEEFLGPVPNIIVFQYNPQSIQRELTPSSAEAEQGGRWGEEITAEPFDPKETFSLELELDASDDLEEPESNPVTAATGLTDRIAALEMLLYPVGQQGNLLGELFPPLGGGPEGFVPRGTVPISLFVWGPGRMVPVRLTSFEVHEQAYSPTLYPIRATVTVGMQVLTEKTFRTLGRPLTTTERLALKAYKFTRDQRETLARANLAHSVESILAMLPF